MKILDLSEFNRIDHRNDTDVSKQVTIPAEIRAIVTASLQLDTRSKSAQPRLVDVYIHLLKIGFSSVKAWQAVRPGQAYKFENLEYRSVKNGLVLYIPDEINRYCKEVAKENDPATSKGQERLRKSKSAAPIIVRLIEIGLKSVKTK